MVWVDEFTRFGHCTANCDFGITPVSVCFLRKRRVLVGLGLSVLWLLEDEFSSVSVSEDFGSSRFGHYFSQYFL